MVLADASRPQNRALVHLPASKLLIQDLTILSATYPWHSVVVCILLVAASQKLHLSSSFLMSSLLVIASVCTQSRWEGMCPQVESAATCCSRRGCVCFSIPELVLELQGETLIAFVILVATSICILPKRTIKPFATTVKRKAQVEQDAANWAVEIDSRHHLCSLCGKVYQCQDTLYYHTKFNHPEWFATHEASQLPTHAHDAESEKRSDVPAKRQGTAGGTGAAETTTSFISTPHSDPMRKCSTDFLNALSAEWSFDAVVIKR